MITTVKVEIEYRHGYYSIVSYDGHEDFVEFVQDRVEHRTLEDNVEDHQMPQNLSEEIVFEKFLEKYQNNLSLLEKIIVCYYWCCCCYLWLSQ